ncbi:MAG: hypothetical protein IT577_03740 [Verrucomicrobiae bacterium]|nr:hypothetical protein [Verrucomicrobiae bacterium]
MGKTGPWGQLQYYSILLEAPASIVKLFPVPSAKTVWKFKDLTRDQIRESVIGAGLTEAQCDRMFAGTADPYLEAGVIHLFPPNELILELTPEVRARVYQILRRCDGNVLHTQPYVIEGGDTSAWFSGSGMRDELVDLIDRTSYPWASGRAFSDLPLLLEHVRDSKEQDLAMKTLTRTRSLLARLIVEKDADIQALSDYWTGLGRRKDVLPILESVAETIGVHRIDIVHLLPSLPRKLLYTYPDISMLAKGALPDCHWTSLNFFNYEPLDRLLDYNGAMQYIGEHYEPAKGSLQFGDVLFFLHKGTEDAFHSCVFVADDIVFTKNGSNIAMPWILMRFDDLLAKYRQDFEVEIRAFRQKP